MPSDGGAPVVETAAGPVQGRRRRGTILFAGIPYAEPPSGALRWKPPVSRKPWTDLVDGSRPSAYAPQPRPLPGVLDDAPAYVDEDCLSLTVHTPSIDDALRPVLLWLHGGGFTGGGGGQPVFDGAPLASRGDLVVVAPNYRLGVLGWGPGPTASGGMPNLGILDQVVALRWVRDNISRFGGDPDRVTVAGQSAGATCVAHLLACPLAAGLFHGAIAQSGAVHGAVDAHDAESLSAAIAAELGAGGSDLDTATWEQIVAVQTGVSRRERMLGRGERSVAPLLSYGPVVDGNVIPDHPLDVLGQGRGAAVPLLVGSTRDEWRLFAAHQPPVEDRAAFERRATHQVRDAEALIEPYLEAAGGDAHEAFCRLQTDRHFRVPALRLAAAHGSHQPADAFVYEFCWPSSDPSLGSCHSLDIPFVFGVLDLPAVWWYTGQNPPSAVSDIVQDAWIAFARTGSPRCDSVADWAPHTRGTAVASIDLEPSVDRARDADLTALWDERI